MSTLQAYSLLLLGALAGSIWTFNILNWTGLP